MFELKQFQQPSSEYGIHPFWFWNGQMEDHEIVLQIEEMAAKEVGGFFICPRQGLQIAYLSDLWFQKVRLAVQTAQRLGLNVYLYDEYPYPSGIAGGEVTLAAPEAKHYTLVHQQHRAEAGQLADIELPWARLLFAKAVPLDAATGVLQWEQAIDLQKYVGNHQAEPVFQKAGLTAYNQKRFFTYKTIKKLQWHVPDGEWEIHCFLEQEIDDFKYYGTFVDPCNAEAMRIFIQLTHERYREEIGEYFGHTVKGMFTDEIGLLGQLPWSPQLLNAFEQRNGYNLQEQLHALLYETGDNASKVRYDYFQSIHELLRSSYHKQVHDWCEANGLQYIAEVPAVRMTTQLYSHVPGGDSGHEKLGRSLEWILDRYAPSLRYNPRMVSSLGNQLNRDRVLIECFHSVGWSMTLQDAKWMIDRLAAMGINFFNFHAFFYTLDSLVKHDAPPSQFLQNPYWQHFKALGMYVKRISYMMSRGAAAKEIAVLDPTTTFWTHMGNPFHEFAYAGNSEQERLKLEQLKAEWFDLCKELALHQKDFDHLDAELLAEAAVEDGVIKLGKAEYRIVVLPTITNLEWKAWMKLKQFIDQGGHVIAAGSLPTERIEAGKDVGAQMQQLIQPIKLEELIGRIDAAIPSSIELAAEHKHAFLMHQRKLPDGSLIVFLSNQEAGAGIVKLTGSALAGITKVQRLYIETGDAVDVAAENGTVELPYASYEAIMLIISSNSTVSANAASHSSGRKLEVSTAGKWQLQAEQYNVVRLDTFGLSIGQHKPSEAVSTPVQVKTFIDQCQDIAQEQHLPLQFSQIFGTPMQLSAKYPIEVAYATEFIVEDLPAACYLLKDKGAIAGQYTIYINEAEYSEEQFYSQNVYDHRNQLCDIANALQIGINHIRIEMTIEHDWDGIVDALYLYGDFAVQFSDEDAKAVQLVKQPQEVEWKVPYVDGYPYYAGTMSFKRSIDITQLEAVSDGEEFILTFNDLDQHFHDTVEIVLNGHSLSAQSWSPYVWQGSSSILHEGKNELEVKITNTLIGMLEGKWFDYANHALRDVRDLE